MIRQILFLIPAGPNRADDHSALSCAKDPTSPTHRRCHFRHVPEGGGEQLPICSARSIVASVSAGQQVRRKIYYNSWLLLGLHDRSSSAEKKEGQGCTGPVDRGNVAPASWRTLSTIHRTSLWTSMATACYVWYPLARWASQVINHRTISRRLPVAKNSTVSDDFPVTREVEKEKLEQRVKESLLLTAVTAASSRRNLFCGRLPI